MVITTVSPALADSMQIQHSKKTAIPTMSSAQISGVFVTCEERGCVYTVCTEGELFYAPMHQDGSVNMEEFDFVDLETMSEEDMEQTEEIQTTLIDMMQSAGLYFRKSVALI